MEILDGILQLIGTAAFAVSGAMIAIRKKMDIFGIAMLGLVTAVGGGMVRDVTLGQTPPAIFYSPVTIVLALVCSLMMFLPFVRRRMQADHRVFDTVLLLADSVGLAVFTSLGVSVAIRAGYGGNAAILIFSGAVTGVGGGVIRDLFAAEEPQIFVKHIYALASIVGAALYIVLMSFLDQKVASILCCAAIVLLRLVAAREKWNLPRA